MKNLHFIWISALLVFFFQVAFAQQKQELPMTEMTDTVWSTGLSLDLISEDGNWRIIKEAFHHKTMAYVMDQNGKTNQTFINPQSYSFSKNSKWMGILSEDSQLHILNLNTQLPISYANVSDFSFSNKDEFLAVLSKNGTQDDLVVVNLETNKKIVLNNITDYKWNPVTGKLLFVQNLSEGFRLSRLDLHTNLKETIYQTEGSAIQNITFSESGKSLVFKESNDSLNTLVFFSDRLGLKTLRNMDLRNACPETKISEKECFVSNDDKTVYFFREKIHKTADDYNSEMEVWNTEDPWLYPKKMIYEKYFWPYLVTVWNAQDNKVKAVSDDENPSCFFNPAGRFAYTFNEIKYDPNYKESEYIDIYCRDLSLNEKYLAIEKVYSKEGFINHSPSGRYIVFFKDDNWQVFDAEKKETINLTASIEYNFTDLKDSPLVEKSPYGMAGWYDNEKFIILYDEFDVWLFSPDGKSIKKITNGRKAKQTFRIDTYSKRFSTTYDLIGKYNLSMSFKADETIIMEMKDQNFNSGLYYFKNYKCKEQIAFRQKKLKGEAVSANQNLIFFSEKFFNFPPAIFVYDLKDKFTKLLYQSNVDLMEKESDRLKILKYKAENKEPLNGILLYPNDFNPNKKYPMIVWIYEKNTVKINNFSPPDKCDFIGFNILYYLSNGYFVFLPEIEYELKKPGESSLKWVELAVNEAIANEKSINKSAIGLMGHSFGGYETLFIATQSKMFKTAVAGSPVSDLKTWYHDVSWVWLRDQIWRLENQQYRLGVGFYDNPEIYNQNSPLTYIENLEIPLLIWTGKNDSNVNWSQSVSFFMAMRRLDKYGKLLLFPNEAHAVMKKENQKLLSDEIFKWFEVFLK